MSPRGVKTQLGIIAWIPHYSGPHAMIPLGVYTPLGIIVWVLYSSMRARHDS